MYNIIKPLKDLDTSSIEQKLNSTRRSRTTVNRIMESSMFIEMQRRLKSGRMVTDFLKHLSYNTYYTYLWLAIKLAPPNSIPFHSIIQAFYFCDDDVFYYFLKSFLLKNQANKIKNCSLKNLIFTIALKKKNNISKERTEL